MRKSHGEPIVRVVACTLLLLVACAVSPGQQAPELRIAAAADLQFAMPDLAAQFQEQTGTKLNVTYGSSGNFFSQIQNGAPFDLFLSADVDYPQRLVSAGFADQATLVEYARGQIVIWVPLSSNLSPARDTWNSLLDPSVQKIAIANPEHAPYGRAAVAALKNAHVYDRVQPNLVFGENISQAAQFVQSGNGQAGIIALSLSTSPSMKTGKSWKVPPDLYPPIRQAAVILKSSSNQRAARAFLQFLKTSPARAILSDYGFLPPDSSPASSPSPSPTHH